MQPNVPIPTESLYKFAALFGLALIITAIIGWLYMHRSLNEEVTTLAREYVTLEASDSKSPMLPILQRRIDVAGSDRDIYSFGLGVVLVTAGLLSAWGFGRWRQKIQPLHDRLLELQVAQAEHKHRLRGGETPSKESVPPADQTTDC